MNRIMIGLLVAVLGVLSLGQAALAAETYVVRSGDTLAKIARERLGDASRVGEIVRRNNLTSPSQLKVGQKLILPDAQPAGTAVSQRSVPASSPAAGTGSAIGWGKSISGGVAIAGVGLMAIACIAWVVGFIMFTIATFRVGFWWGVGSLLIQPVWIIFLVRHWEQGKRGFIIQTVAGAIAAPCLFLLSLLIS